jgi:hypothetical protein
MSKELDALIHFTLLAAAIVLFFIKYTPGTGKAVRFLGIYLLLTFIFDAFAATIMFHPPLAKALNNNLFVYHFLIPLQFITVMMLYYQVFLNSFIRRSLIWLGILFTLFSIIMSATLQPLSDYNSYSILLKYTLIVLIVMFYFYETFRVTLYPEIHKHSLFWISVGFLFHSISNIFLEGLSNYLLDNNSEAFQKVYALYSFSNYLQFTFFIVALILLKKTPLVQNAKQ